MDDSQLFELVKDDYELDTSNSPLFSYHLLCKRANGYLFIDDSAFQGINMPSAVPIGISENRGKGFDKFRIIYGNGTTDRHRMGYFCNDRNKTEYKLAAKFVNKSESWLSNDDKIVSEEKIELWFVKSSIYDKNETLKNGKYARLELKNKNSTFMYLLLDDFKNKTGDTTYVVSIKPENEIILERISDGDDAMCVYQESQLLSQYHKISV